MPNHCSTLQVRLMYLTGFLLPRVCEHYSRKVEDCYRLAIRIVCSTLREESHRVALGPATLSCAELCHERPEFLQGRLVRGIQPVCVLVVCGRQDGGSAKALRRTQKENTSSHMPWRPTAHAEPCRGTEGYRRSIEHFATQSSVSAGKPREGFVG